MEPVPSGVKAPSGTEDSVSSSSEELFSDCAESDCVEEGFWLASLLSALVVVLEEGFCVGEGVAVEAATVCCCV